MSPNVLVWYVDMTLQGAENDNASLLIWAIQHSCVQTLTMKKKP